MSRVTSDFMVVIVIVSFDVSVFFFKQNTAYELRISDWSSDVCSSDLPHQPDRQLRNRRPGRRRGPHRPQDNRRHLWRRIAPWRRRVQRQGTDQGRPLGRLYHPLPREEPRRLPSRADQHHPAPLRPRRFPSGSPPCWHPPPRTPLPTPEKNRE